MSRSNHYGKWFKHPKYFKWNAKEPKWWRKMMKHKKRRQSARHSSFLVIRSFNYGEDVMWHLNKKPWIYFW